MVHGRKSTGFIFHVIRRRYYFIYYPTGKKSRGALAIRLFFPPPVMVNALWIVQCFYPFMVLGYFISLCLYWYDHVCFSSFISKSIDHSCSSFTAFNDNEGKCGCFPG